MIEKPPVVSSLEMVDVLMNEKHYLPLSPIIEKANNEYEHWKSLKYKNCLMVSLHRICGNALKCSG